MIRIPENEVEFSAIRAQGAGGQNVNKVSTAVHLRFDIQASSLPQRIKQRLMTLRDHRITGDGVVIIKAQNYRSQEKNREDAMRRLQELVAEAARVPKARKPTRPGKNARRKRMDSKTRRGATKKLRGKVNFNGD